MVIPVYNSGSILARLIGRLNPVLRQLGADHEVILVDDGSRDDSWAAVQAQSAEHSHVRGLRMMRNYGQHNALLCGIRAARYDRVITMDDDLQHRPEEIPTLLKELAQGHDVVYGPPIDHQHGLWRWFASYITKLTLQKAMGSETARSTSAFRAFRTDLRRAFSHYRGQFVSLDVLLTWATTRFSLVKVPHDPRADGVSNYTVRKLVVHALNMMTGFSVFPLQIASLVGFFFTLIGVGLFLFVIGRFLLFGTSVPGFPFLASTIAILSGAQLFALGIMGEYLARMHFRSMDRPPYAIAEETRHRGQA